MKMRECNRTIAAPSEAIAFSGAAAPPVRTSSGMKSYGDSTAKDLGLGDEGIAGFRY